MLSPLNSNNEVGITGLRLGLELAFADRFVLM
jgi:hypothetical protein